MDTVQVDDLDTPLVGKHPSINTGSPFVDRRAAKFNRFAEARADRSGSFEFFHTPYTSTKRQIDAQTSVFNLVSTIVGGGVLSLPFTFAQSGIALGAIMLVFSATASGFSVWLLISCSRRTGAQTYEDVAAVAFGPFARMAVVFLLFICTFLSSVGYVVLVRDLVSPVVIQLTGIFDDQNHRNAIVAIVFVLISPVCLLRSLKGLRCTSLLSLFSISILALAIGYRTFDAFYLRDPPKQLKRAIYFTTDWRQATFSFPIISVAFLCHFNVLPLHEEFFRPTRQRLRAVVRTTMSITSVFYLVLGVLGYVFAFNGDSDATADCGPAQCHGIYGDILNNFDSADPLINTGRIGLSVTLLSSFPLLILPCRNSLQRLIFLTKAQFSTCKKAVGCGSARASVVRLGYGSPSAAQDAANAASQPPALSIGEARINSDSLEGGGKANTQARGKTKKNADAKGGKGYGAIIAPRNPTTIQLQPIPATLNLCATPRTARQITATPDPDTGVQYCMYAQTPCDISVSAPLPHNTLRSRLLDPPQNTHTGAPPPLPLTLHSQTPPHFSTFFVLTGAPPPLPFSQHALLTLGIIGTSILLAVNVPAITLIWSLMGSSVALLIAYIIPTACYLRIRGGSGNAGLRRMMAWALLIGASIMCVVCTSQSIATAQGSAQGS
jgi:amino acid permease